MLACEVIRPSSSRAPRVPPKSNMEVFHYFTPRRPLRNKIRLRMPVSVYVCQVQLPPAVATWAFLHQGPSEKRSVGPCLISSLLICCGSPASVGRTIAGERDRQRGRGRERERVELNQSGLVMPTQSPEMATHSCYVAASAIHQPQVFVFGADQAKLANPPPHDLTVFNSFCYLCSEYLGSE